MLSVTLQDTAAFPVALIFGLSQQDGDLDVKLGLTTSVDDTADPESDSNHSGDDTIGTALKKKTAFNVSLKVC